MHLARIAAAGERQARTARPTRHALELVARAREGKQPKLGQAEVQIGWRTRSSMVTNAITPCPHHEHPPNRGPETRPCAGQPAQMLGRTTERHRSRDAFVTTASALP